MMLQKDRFYGDEEIMFGGLNELMFNVYFAYENVITGKVHKWIMIIF